MPGNGGDAETAEGLLADLLRGSQDGPVPAAGGEGQPTVYGDAAYGSGELIERLESAGIRNGIKCPPPAVKGCFPEDRFAIEPGAGTVTCPAAATVPIRARDRRRHAGTARFGAACRTCPLASQCTISRDGRRITIGHH